MGKYICVVCGCFYDHELGDPDNYPATKFEDLPTGLLCSVGKGAFAEAKI